MHFGTSFKVDDQIIHNLYGDHSIRILFTAKTDSNVDPSNYEYLLNRNTLISEVTLKLLAVSVFTHEIDPTCVTCISVLSVFSNVTS